MLVHEHLSIGDVGTGTWTNPTKIGVGVKMVKHAEVSEVRCCYFILDANRIPELEVAIWAVGTRRSQVMWFLDTTILRARAAVSSF